ncbi:hypothetical protein F4802DRAFT_442590 [Xylaria palmicola]|nr:hypothetical protein F4802DRAFT_442590 [Xylaria palmicola]
MAGNSGPRSVADATRFTSNTPHANAKPAPASRAAVAARPNASSSSAQQGLPRRGGVGVGVGTASIPKETMEERVRRLRAAHLAAKQHSVSRMDRVIGNSRRFFDAAHKFTVMGLIGFSGIAFFVTVYATVDMMVHNRKRRNEFFAVQKQMKEDSLEAARLAYMTGSATEEQIALVEDATARAKEAGTALPAILSAPRSHADAETNTTTATATADRTVWPGEAMVESSPDGAETQKKGGITGWLFGGLKKEDVGGSGSTNATAETLRDGDERWRTTPPTTTPGAVRDTAKAAFEQERDNQRRGGPLDQVGLDRPAAGEGEKKKKGWLW